MRQRKVREKRISSWWQAEGHSVGPDAWCNYRNPAFRTRRKAEAFRKSHGGEYLTHREEVKVYDATGRRVDDSWHITIHAPTGKERYI